MPPAVATFTQRYAPAALLRVGVWPVLMLVTLHGAALALMASTEPDWTARLAFVLTWGALNFFWLAVLRRPATAAATALLLLAALVLLSRFKHGIQLMTVNFLDLMIVDADTVSFLMLVFPELARHLVVAALAAVPALVLIWRSDPWRVGRRAAAASAGACLAALAALSFSAPSDLYDEFVSAGYVSKFARSAVSGLTEFATRGYLEADASVSERLALAPPACAMSAAKPPHIVMVFDESSFDLGALPGIKTPVGYRDHFRSSDGKARKLLVEGAGGPSWFTEYNVLTGLSARSYGRFADFVTRIAGGRVERGLPRALSRCGYRTTSLYPMWGAFAGARRFQETAGIERFLDARDLGMRKIEPDHFYFDVAARLIERERAEGPMFLLVYTAANHFPWTSRYRPDLTPGWRDPGNGAEVDEYLRRQSMSAQDYSAFSERLTREFPGESFLIVRFGDHQPSFAKHLVDPTLDDSAVGRRLAEADPKFLTTYYAIDTIRFSPAGLDSARETLDAPYLPLVVMEAAGVALDPSFAEQKRILERCRGLFYRCAGGAEARRFNRLLIDAGLIKGM